MVRRLKEVQFKVINDGVTKIKTEDLVQTLIDLSVNYTVPRKKVETLGDTLVVETERHFSIH